MFLFVSQMNFTLLSGQPDPAQVLHRGLKAVIRISCNLMPWLVSQDIFWVVLGEKKNVSNLQFKIGPFREIKTDLSLN